MSECAPHIFIPFATVMFAIFALLGASAGFIIGWVMRDMKKERPHD